MNLNDHKNSNMKGNVGLGAAIAHFSRRGYVVCIPLTDCQPYDLIVDDGKIYRVQVKTTTHKTKYGIYVVSLRTQGGNRSWTGVVKLFNPKNVDLLFVYTDQGSYSIPSSKIKVQDLSLGELYQKFKI